MTDQIVLDDLLPRDSYEMRLLGLEEVTSELAWDHEKANPQTATVFLIPKADARREVLARFRIDQGKLLVRWSHHDPGHARRLQDVIRDCVLDIRGTKDPEMRLVALQAPLVIKGERLDRLLKGDKKIQLSRSMSVLGKRTLYLEPLELVLDGEVYDSESISIPTVEKPEEQAVLDKRAAAKREMEGGTFIGGKGPGKSSDTPRADTPPAGTGRASRPAPGTADDGFNPVDIRQQDFPEIAEDLGLEYFFVEIFPHADHIVVRVDTQPSQRDLMSRLLAVKNKTRTGTGGTAPLLPTIGPAGGVPAAVPVPDRIPATEPELTALLAKLKSDFAEIGSGVVSGVCCRMVEGVRVDVIRFGELTGKGGGSLNDPPPE